MVLPNCYLPARYIFRSFIQGDFKIESNSFWVHSSVFSHKTIVSTKSKGNWTFSSGQRVAISSLWCEAWSCPQLITVPLPAAVVALRAGEAAVKCTVLDNREKHTVLFLFLNRAWELFPNCLQVIMTCYSGVWQPLP